MADQSLPFPESGPDGYPSVAVVIPAKNEAANIGICLEAIGRQDYPPELIRIIVVDNGSTDETQALAEEAGASVLVDVDSSIAGLRNLGASHFDSDVLAFIDADMIPSVGWLKQATSVLGELNVGAVGGMLNIPDDADWVERAWCINRQTKPEKAEFSWLPSGNLLINRVAFQAIGGFDESLTTCEDLDICSRLRGAGFKLMFVKSASVIHTGESKSAWAMFKKEVWRGKNSIGRLHVIMDNPREMISILLPVAQLVLLVLPLVLLLTGHFRWALGALLLSLGLPVLRASIICFQLRTGRYFFPLVGVWYIYYLARASAVIYR